MATTIKTFPQVALNATQRSSVVTYLGAAWPTIVPARVTHIAGYRRANGGASMRVREEAEITATQYLLVRQQRRPISIVSHSVDHTTVTVRQITTGNGGVENPTTGEISYSDLGTMISTVFSQALSDTYAFVLQRNISTGDITGTISIRWEFTDPVLWLELIDSGEARADLLFE